MRLTSVEIKNVIIHVDRDIWIESKKQLITTIKIVEINENKYRLKDTIKRPLLD